MARSSSLAAELTRVPIENLRKIEVKPPRKGRLNVRFEYQAGLGSNKTGAWIEEAHEAELNELVSAVQAKIGAAE
jgi:hypothetical protein